jgi:hypothetical protein
LNPHALLEAADFKSAASADFAIRACFYYGADGLGDSGVQRLYFVAFERISIDPGLPQLAPARQALV